MRVNSNGYRFIWQITIILHIMKDMHLVLLRKKQNNHFKGELINVLIKIHNILAVNIWYE